jgi:hypothetical protein
MIAPAIKEEQTHDFNLGAQPSVIHIFMAAANSHAYISRLWMKHPKNTLADPRITLRTCNAV